MKNEFNLDDAISYVRKNKGNKLTNNIMYPDNYIISYDGDIVLREYVDLINNINLTVVDSFIFFSDNYKSHEYYIEKSIHEFYEIWDPNKLKNIILKRIFKF